MLSSCSIFLIIFSFVSYLNKYSFIQLTTVLVLISYFLILIYKWLHNLYTESTVLGRYNVKVTASIFSGFLFFLVSEIMLFSGFSWMFFDRLFHVSVYTMNSTHPFGITNLISPLSIPFAATLVLLSSGYLCNDSYYIYLLGFQSASRRELLYTILLAFTFIYLQYVEYTEIMFTISDSVYSSIFFLLTGFHGMHVIVGFLFSLGQLIKLGFLSTSLPSMITSYGIAVIYWHFVDIIWIFLYYFVYVLQNWKSFSWITMTVEQRMDGVSVKYAFVACISEE